MSTGPISSKPEGFPGGSVVKNLPANVRDARDKGDVSSIPELRRSPGGGNGIPLQYSFLENPTEEEPGGLTAHGLTSSQTQSGDGHFRFLSLHCEHEMEPVG